MCPARKDPDNGTYVGRFAVRLRRLRVKAGLSQEDVASALGVTTTTYYRWESGQNHPKPDLLPDIAQTLGLAKTKTLFPDN